MQKESANLPEIKLVGISIRTNNKTDFELYNERAANHEKVVLDIFIGLKS